MNDRARAMQFVTSTLYANRRLRCFMQTATLIAQRTVYGDRRTTTNLPRDLHALTNCLMTASRRAFNDVARTRDIRTIKLKVVEDILKESLVSLGNCSYHALIYMQCARLINNTRFMRTPQRYTSKIRFP